MLWGAFFICGIGSIFCFVVGYFIWKKEKLTLIIGFNEETFSGDRGKLAKAVGTLMVGMGVLVLLLPFSLEYIGSLTGPAYAIIIVCGTMLLMRGARLAK